MASTARVSMSFHMVIVVEATLCSATTIARTISEMISPYSTAVAPDVSSNSSLTKVDDIGFFPIPFGLTQQRSRVGVKKWLREGSRMERNPT